MDAAVFDPYRAASRMRWRTRWTQWRAHPGESCFLALATIAAAGLLLGLLSTQAGTLRRGIQWALQSYPLELAVATALIIALGHARARRAQRREWSRDWFAAQPIRSGVRARRRLIAAGARVLLQLTLVLGLLALTRTTIGYALVATALVLCGAVLGNLAGDFEHIRRASARASRQTPFVWRAPGRVWRWQAIEAGASLAPRRMGWMLMVILLVPRGPALMALVAACLLLVVAAATAWQRALAVIPMAQRWLQEQPVIAWQWWVPAVLAPLSVLLIAVAGLVALLWHARLPSLALGCVIGVPALALLQLLVVVAERRQPRRITPLLLVHVLLLLTVLQSLPPAAPIVWLAQAGLLLRKALRP